MSASVFVRVYPNVCGPIIRVAWESFCLGYNTKTSWYDQIAKDLIKRVEKTDQNSLRVWLMPSQTITSIKEISVLVRPDGLVVWRITVTLESSPSNQIMACPPIPRQACHGARLVQENQSQCIEVKKPALASLWNSFCDL